MICRRGVRFPAPTHRPRLKDAAQAKASGPGAGLFPTLAAGAGRPLACPDIRRLCGCGASPMRRADPGHHAGGAIRFAPSRNDPLASAGRSAFTLRGSEPPRQLRPALVCLRRDPLLLCEANHPAFGSLRRGSADLLRHVWLTTRGAGNPLAAAGPNCLGQMASLHLRSADPPRLSASPRCRSADQDCVANLTLPLARSPAPAPLAPRWALPPRPEAPPVPQSIGNRAEADSVAGPSLAGPTPATSFDDRTTWPGPAALPARLGSSSRRSASRRTPRASSDPRRAATKRAGSLRFLQSVRSSRWPPVCVRPLKRRMAGLRDVADRGDGRKRLHPHGLLHSARALSAFIAKARSSLPQDGPLALRKRDSAGRGLHLPSGNARLGNPDRQAPTSHNRAIIQRRGWRNPRSTFGEMLPLPSVAGAAYRPLRALRDAPVALAGCALRRRPARCTSHGPRLDRRAAPHRDRHSPFAPLRSGGPQAATPATPRLLRGSRRPLFRARCASGQPSPVPRSRLRQAPPSPRCPAWPALSRNPGHPPLRARFPRRLASHFSPDGAGPPPAIWQFNPAWKYANTP